MGLVPRIQTTHFEINVTFVYTFMALQNQLNDATLRADKYPKILLLRADAVLGIRQTSVRYIKLHHIMRVPRVSF